ncbi:MAG TPA: Hsp70 family protein, partial [Pseudonocardia sp.]
MGSAVGYSLGVDLGNTYVAAAVDRGSEVEMCTLGESSLVMPAVVHIAEGGTTTVGDPAMRRGLAHPDRLVRGLRRRLGDRTPLLIGGHPYEVPDLLAVLLRTVLAKVTEQQGAPPERVVLARPASWDPDRCAAFDSVARLAGIDDARTVSEPEAVTAQYAASRELAEGRVLGVYDLGGGTFEVSLVRRLAGGVEIVGRPQGIERLGGLDFDEALVDLVDGSLGGRLRQVKPDDPGAARFLARLRVQCEQAKEALSADDTVEIPVSIGAEQFDARITRADLEHVIGVPVRSTVQAVEAALRSAGMSAGELDGLLLVGGSSRIPLVSRTIAEAFGCPVRTNVSAKNLVALGAAAAEGRTASAPSDARRPTPRVP